MRPIDADAFIAKLDHVPMVQEAIRKAMDTMPTIELPYTDEEIQAMQDLEQAQLDKAYELGWKDGREALRREIWEDGRDRLD